MIFTVQESTKLSFCEFNNKDSIYYCPEINTLTFYKLSVINVTGKVDFTEKKADERYAKIEMITKDFNYECKGSLYEIETGTNSTLKFEITRIL